MTNDLAIGRLDAGATRADTASMASAAANVMWKFWYPLLTRLTRQAPIVFLNYGYAENGAGASGPTLSVDDEVDRPCIQLYDSVARRASLQGLRVLEVSCGHGGGASYIARYFHPESMHGIDRNARAIDLCRKRHSASNLTFSHGNALALDFSEATFDAVINVEASHCYPDMPQFLREVFRVLRPGGHLLYADFRPAIPGAAVLRRQLEESGMEIVAADDISQQVVRGMQLNTQKYLLLIRQHVPALLRKLAMRFAGVPGSAIYEELRSGQTVYLRFVLRKPGGQASPPRG